MVPALYRTQVEWVPDEPDGDDVNIEELVNTLKAQLDELGVRWLRRRRGRSEGEAGARARRRSISPCFSPTVQLPGLSSGDLPEDPSMMAYWYVSGADCGLIAARHWRRRWSLMQSPPVSPPFSLLPHTV